MEVMWTVWYNDLPERHETIYKPLLKPPII